MLIADTFFGTIRPPAVIQSYGTSGGLVVLTSNLLRLAVIVGGLLALFNIVMAGYTYLTSSGDSKAHEKVMSKLTMSLWGIVLMIMAPALMAIAGWVLFKNSMYFLNPTLTGPGAQSNTPSSGDSGDIFLPGPGTPGGNVPQF
jgi:hypothetical protein